MASLPPAHVVRSGGVSFAPPGVSLRERWARAVRPVATFLGYCVALAPLTVVVLAAALGILAISISVDP